MALIDQVGGAAGGIAILGLLLVLPLYLSQRRDIGRLREWAAREPTRGEGAADRAAAAVAARRAEPTPAPQPTTPPASPAAAPSSGPGVLTPAERVLGERPAIARRGLLTQETAGHLALRGLPWWRRWLDHVRNPRHPLVIAAVAVIVGVVIYIGTVQLLSGRDGGDLTEPSPVIPAEVDVTVLNATPEAGIAGEVSQDLSKAGFTGASPGAIGETAPKTVVMYEEEHRREATEVARALDVKRTEPIDASVRTAASGSDVVVLAGEDLLAEG